VYKSVLISSSFHVFVIFFAMITLPFIAKTPLDLPPLVSVELIQITDKTNIPFAPKAKKIIEKIKKENEKLVSEQAPPKKIKKEKTKAIPSPDLKNEEIKKEKNDAVPLPDKEIELVKKPKETKQSPSLEETKIKQVSEFEKEEIVDPNEIAKLINKAKEDLAQTTKKPDKNTQSQDPDMITQGLTLSEEDALKAQIFGCWTIPLNLPYNKDLLVKIKLKLKPDGNIIETEILDHARMNTPGQTSFKVLARSALRALGNPLCIPLKVPTTGYERWKDILFTFDPREMLEG